MRKRLIIILGYALSPDGQIPPILQSRLDEAISIYQQTDTLLVCGKWPPQATVPMRCEHTTEAEAMKQYLLLHGISEKNILKEEESATTFGNALFSYVNICNSIETYQSIIVISNEFHEPLVKYSFDKIFGNKYLYTFHAVPDTKLDIAPEKLEQSKYLISQLLEKCYPLLFPDVQNGDINAIKLNIESSQRIPFELSVKKLLCLEESAEIVIASEEEINANFCNMNKIR